MISFFAAGTPAPGGSKRGYIVKGRVNIVEDCKGNKRWRSIVAGSAKPHFPEPLEGPLRLEVEFRLHRPKGHMGTGRNAGKVKPSARPYPTVKPDATKLLRSTEDALTGIAWVDDAQIVEQEVAKVYVTPDKEAGAWIVVERIEE